MNDIFGYQPKNEEEHSAYECFLHLLKQDEGATLNRGENGHVTATALVFDKTGKKILLMHHKLFNAYSAPGGHADGERDPLVTALREVKEETGITAYPITTRAVAFCALPVFAHTRKGEFVAKHTHYVFCYLAIAENEDIVNCDLEAYDTRFVEVLDLEKWVTEPKMLALYQNCIATLNGILKEKEDAFSALPKRLVPWFLKNQRDLPWRKNRTPYRVWLSEVMLQQTRVEAVIDYYNRFLQAVPDIQTLAALDDGQLMKLWEGLGYYTRMRNLKAAALHIVENHNGNFPNLEKELALLPGVGEYTAGAIASIAFGHASAAVDGNVIRVVKRITEDFSLTNAYSRKALKKGLEEIYPIGQEGNFTESLMELGATVCLPNGEPRCAICPINNLCLSKRNGVQRLLPIKATKAPRKAVPITIFIVRNNRGDFAVRKREKGGVLNGLWEFPNQEKTLSPAEAQQTLRASGYQSAVILKSFTDKHIFTHLTWEMTVYLAQADTFAPETRMADKSAMDNEIGLPTAFRKLFKKI